MLDIYYYFLTYNKLIKIKWSRDQVECLHGHPVGEDTRLVTGCSSVGPPFELQGIHLIPSYGLKLVGSDKTIKV